MGGHLSREEYNSQVNAVWKATAILSIVTIAEIGLALLHYWGYFHMSKSYLSIIMIVLSLAKAYFIVGEFMHIKYEKRALTLSILVPLVFLVYGVIMFMQEGGAWNLMRDWVN